MFSGESKAALNTQNGVRGEDAAVVFMMGRHDLHTPYSGAKRYFDMITAPSKEYVTFENSAHVPFLEEPGRFFEALMQYVQRRAR